MKQARPRTEEIEQLRELMMMLQAFLEDHEFDGRKCDDTTFLRHLNRKWFGSGSESGVSTSWQRVYYGMKLAFDEATDPNQNILDWKPEIKAALVKEGVIRE